MISVLLVIVKVALKLTSWLFHFKCAVALSQNDEFVSLSKHTYMDLAVYYQTKQYCMSTHTCSNSCVYALNTVGPERPLQQMLFIEGVLSASLSCVKALSAVTTGFSAY